MPQTFEKIASDTFTVELPAYESVIPYPQTPAPVSSPSGKAPEKSE